MKLPLTILSAAVVLGLCLGSVEAKDRRTTSEPLPSPKQRCLNQCDSKHEQCFREGTNHDNCNAAHVTCRESCDFVPAQ